MNTLLDSRYDEQVARLALGLEPLDAVTGRPLAGGLDIHVEGAGPDIAPRRYGRYALVYGRRVRDVVAVRISDPERRVVARRLRIPIVPEARVLALEAAGNSLSARLRVRRPVMYPGAAYRAAAGATTIRGRAQRGAVPARWVRVEATLPSGVVVGRGHGDDRGEFLVILASAPGYVAVGAATPFEAFVTVTVRAPAVVAAAPDPPPSDPLWDLPLESAAVAADAVLAGTRLPPGYEPGVVAMRTVTVILGRAAVERLPFSLN